MSSPIISIRGIGKMFELGAEKRHDTLRDFLGNAARRIAGRKVAARRPEFWALRDVSFDVEAGEVIGIVGRNGAGKSTLLKILSQITDPTEGEIRIRGRVASLLEVGTGFHSELTGRENIYLNGAILGLRRSEIRAKFDEIVAFAGVENFLDTPVKHYSSGMHVRLAFAVAAHMEPEILVVDEVLAVGDAAFQAKCLAKMDAVAGKEGRTVLFVSHNLAAVQGLCRSGVLLEKGRVVERGPMAQVIDAYQRALAEGPASRASDMQSVPEDGARIVDWELRGAGTGDLHSCFARETCQFVFKVASKTNVDEINIGFLVLNAQGEIVVGVTSLDQTPAQFPLTPGMHELSISVPMPLKPGVYHLDVSLNNRVRGQLERAHPVPALSILPPGPTRMAPKYQGSVSVGAKFDLHPSS